MTRSRITAADANREFYEQVAEQYDATEGCVVNARLKQRLVETLQFALSNVGSGTDLQVLDACGGSGNVSLILLEMGIVPLTVDLSPEMLGIYERKARVAGYRPRTEVDEIDCFLQHTKGTWDVVVFSSALHHLEDYIAVMAAAMDRVRPGGVIVTIFDPTRVGRIGLVFRRADYLAYTATRDFTHLCARVRGRLRDAFGRTPDASAYVGALAERYALIGVDEIALGALAAERDWRVLRHVRFYEARFRLSRLMLKGARKPSSFSMVLRAPTSDGHVMRLS